MEKEKYSFKNSIFICVLIILLISLLSVSIILFCFKINKNNLPDNNSPKGVWWWDNRLSDEYLDFAQQNNINEIYYYTSDFSQKNSDFIKNANNRNIDVYWLCGDYVYIDDYSLFYLEMDKFIEFQSLNKDNNFEGVHLDVEPHQNPDWENDRENIIIRYLDFVKTVTERYSYIKFDFDIPFWFDDIINFDNQTKELYKFVFDYADRVFVMSYRDSAEEMVKVSSEELDYAKEINKSIFLSVETGEEEDIVTYYQEGKAYLYSQIENLKDLINQDFGLAIHHIKSWKELKD